MTITNKVPDFLPSELKESITTTSVDRGRGMEERSETEVEDSTENEADVRQSNAEVGGAKNTPGGSQGVEEQGGGESSDVYRNIRNTPGKVERGRDIGREGAQDDRAFGTDIRGGGGGLDTPHTVDALTPADEPTKGSGADVRPVNLGEGAGEFDEDEDEDEDEEASSLGSAFRQNRDDSEQGDADAQERSENVPLPTTFSSDSSSSPPSRLDIVQRIENESGGHDDEKSSDLNRDESVASHAVHSGIGETDGIDVAEGESIDNTRRSTSNTSAGAAENEKTSDKCSLGGDSEEGDEGHHEAGTPMKQQRVLLCLNSVEAYDMPETESGLGWGYKQDPYFKVLVNEEERYRSATIKDGGRAVLWRSQDGSRAAGVTLLERVKEDTREGEEEDGASMLRTSPGQIDLLHSARIGLDSSSTSPALVSVAQLRNAVSEPIHAGQLRVRIEVRAKN